MTDDIRLAFAHPEERSAATAGSDPVDRLSVRDHVVEAEIGAFQSERGQTQRLRFNIVVEVGTAPASLQDDVDRILSYDTLTEAVDDALAEERVNLLETLAERVAERVLAAPQARRCFVRIEKLDRGPGALGVEIVRAQPAGGRPSLAAAPPRPVVAFLSEGVADDAGRLAGWLDLLGGRPVVLCAGRSGATPPHAARPEAQRRIDLLALDQEAWALAARDARLTVTATRTELDWALRQGQPSVWAPSKMVLDAVEAGPGDTVDPARLAAWLAGVTGAERAVFVGAPPPDGVQAEHRSAGADSLL